LTAIKGRGACPAGRLAGCAPCGLSPRLGGHVDVHQRCRSAGAI